MLKIGELAALCHIHTQTLRYWDSVGILKADHVDTFTGYRYYSPERVETVRRIRMYQSIGFSLEEIAILFSNMPEQNTRLMTQKRAELNDALQEVQGKLSHLEMLSRERAARAERDLLSHIRGEDFENDEAILGRWILCGRFDAAPDASPTPEDPHTEAVPWEDGIPHLVFLPDGNCWWGVSWSRGTVYFLHAGYKSFIPAPYTLWERPNGRFMTLRYEDPKTLRENAPPHWLLYRQTEHSPLSERESHTVVDDTTLPLRSDPTVLGRWEAVDFLDDPKDFCPDRPVCSRNALWVIGLTFTAGNTCIRHLAQRGDVAEQLLVYTATDNAADICPGMAARGAILRPDEAVSETYGIRRIGDRDYLFVQHKSGDYIYGGLTPSWYVFRRADDGPIFP